MEVGTLVRIVDRGDVERLTPWAQRAFSQKTPMLVVPDPPHWVEENEEVRCVLFEGKLRVLSVNNLEEVSPL